MWIERYGKKTSFINKLKNLNQQVIIVRGARQVGKTSFILKALEELADWPQLKLNLLYPTTFKLDGVEYLGRDFFGQDPSGLEFLKNLELHFGKIENLNREALVFLDEVDRYPLVMESIQTLAEFSNKIKFIFTGSQLENIQVKNAATGRKSYFDLYPITFREFLYHSQDTAIISVFNNTSFKDSDISEWSHSKLKNLIDVYIRIGGLPRIVTSYLERKANLIPDIIKDLAVTIEENIKTVLDDKLKLYEYEDVLRKLAFLSMNTLKWSQFQVQHASRTEAKRLVNKTIGARVAHKIRLYDSEKDFSKYILFDCGIVNYLMNGADLLKTTIHPKNLSILYETFVGNELISHLLTRDDLFYWKSGNKAEVEFLIRSPFIIGIDVKSTRGDSKSLHSLALMEPNAKFLIKIVDHSSKIHLNHQAKLPNYQGVKKVTLIELPHYLTSRLSELTNLLGQS